MLTYYNYSIFAIISIYMAAREAVNNTVNEAGAIGIPMASGRGRGGVWWHSA